MILPKNCAGNAAIIGQIVAVIHGDEQAQPANVLHLTKQAQGRYFVGRAVNDGVGQPNPLRFIRTADPITGTRAAAFFLE